MTGTPITVTAMTFPNITYFISFNLSLNCTEGTNMRKEQIRKEKRQIK